MEGWLAGQYSQHIFHRNSTIQDRALTELGKSCLFENVSYCGSGSSVTAFDKVIQILVLSHEKRDFPKKNFVRRLMPGHAQ